MYQLLHYLFAVGIGIITFCLTQMAFLNMCRVEMEVKKDQLVKAIVRNQSKR